MDKRQSGHNNDIDPLDREELGALLRLFSSLGVTVALGILGFFLAGLWVDRKLRAMGWTTYNIPRILFLLFGLALTAYWAYLRIIRHLKRYDKHPESSNTSYKQ